MNTGLGPMKIRHHGYSQRGDLPSITGHMLEALRRLSVAEETGEKWMDLDDADYRTAPALLKRGWIAVRGSKYKDYRITEDGKRALRAYGEKRNRRDGICPNCNERPKHVRSSGTKEAYCLPCLRQRSLWKYHHKQNRKPGRICSRCHEKECHIYPGGQVASYCKECAHIVRVESQQQKSDELKGRVAAGEFVKCRIPGCENPIHTTANKAWTLCFEHAQQYWTTKNRRTQRRRKAERDAQPPVTAEEVFRRRPGIGTIEHMPYVVKNGQRYYRWDQVDKWAAANVPRDLITCDECGSKKRVQVEIVCPEGYAIYHCGKCQRRFRVVLEYNAFIQDEV